jgi:hypothetical protein
MKRLTVTVWLPDQIKKVEQYENALKTIRDSITDVARAYGMLVNGCRTEHDFGAATVMQAAICAKDNCGAYKPIGCDWEALRAAWVAQDQKPVDTDAPPALPSAP